jgi:hypothetical protein
MSTDEQLPEAWFRTFDGTDLAGRQDVSAILATVDEDGWPHVSFLSVGEILVRDAAHLSLLLWPASTTARNIGRSGRAILFAAIEGSVWEARLDAHAVQDGVEGAARFDARVTAARRHLAPYAEVTGMIGFRLHDSEDVLARWRGQIDRLAGVTDPQP